jgi:hypothetical protein
MRRVLVLFLGLFCAQTMSLAGALAQTSSYKQANLASEPAGLAPVTVTTTITISLSHPTSASLTVQ